MVDGDRLVGLQSLLLIRRGFRKRPFVGSWGHH